MTEQELAAWLWPRLKDRLAPPEGWAGAIRFQWLLDGKRINAMQLWTWAIAPLIEAERVELAFPENYWNMTIVGSQLRLQFIKQVGLDKESNNAG